MYPLFEDLHWDEKRPDSHTTGICRARALIQGAGNVLGGHKT